MLPEVCIAALKVTGHGSLSDASRLVRGGSRLALPSPPTGRTGKGRGEDRHVGAGLEPRNVRRVLDGLLKNANLPHIRFHDLRHSAASLLIARGIELVEVSQLLGHSELRVTADLYTPS